MKKLFYHLAFMLLLSAGLTACSNDYDDPPEQPGTHQDETPTDSTNVNPQGDSSDDYTVILPVPVSDEVKAFFDEALPWRAAFPSFSFSSQEDRECDIIDSQEELCNRYHGTKSVPQINFDENMLVVGKALMPGSTYRVDSLKLLCSEKSTTLNVYTYEPPYLYASLYDMHFWGLFPKLENKTINNIQIIINENKDDYE